jgi:hypothetical protein
MDVSESLRKRLKQASRIERSAGAIAATLPGGKLGAVPHALHAQPKAAGRMGGIARPLSQRMLTKV